MLNLALNKYAFFFLVFLLFNLFFPLSFSVLLVSPVSHLVAVVRGSTAESCDMQAGPVQSRKAINKDSGVVASVAALGSRARTKTL